MALLEPLQEGGLETTMAARAVEALVVGARPLLGERLRTLPPLPHGIPALAKARLPPFPSSPRGAWVACAVRG